MRHSSGARLSNAIFILEDRPQSGGVQLLAGIVHHRLHHLTELDLEAPRQLHAIFRFEQIRYSTLARLTVHADHGVVTTPQVLRVDRQIGHLPDIAVTSRCKGLLDCILMRAGERGVDQVTRIGVTRVHRQLIAIFNAASHFINVRKIEIRRNALRVKVQRNIDDIDISRALTIAKQATLQAISARHQREFACRRAGAPIIVRVDRQHDRITTCQMAMHPFDHVRKDVRR